MPNELCCSSVTILAPTSIWNVLAALHVQEPKAAAWHLCFLKLRGHDVRGKNGNLARLQWVSGPCLLPQYWEIQEILAWPYSLSICPGVWTRAQFAIDLDQIRPLLGPICGEMTGTCAPEPREQRHGADKPETRLTWFTSSTSASFVAMSNLTSAWLETRSWERRSVV